MKVTPIIFSAPMIRALLDGRKSQTRRVIKFGDGTLPSGPVDFDDDGWPLAYYERDDEILRMPCPYGGPGDLLWVREKWAPVNEIDCDPSDGAIFPDSPPPYRPDRVERWRPSIHMPRWASRITLRLTDVRVERLQEISEADAEAEGVRRSERAVSPSGAAPCFWDYLRDEPQYCSARDSYASLWESINGPGSWEANPWVWVLSFEVIKSNVGQVSPTPPAAAGGPRDSKSRRPPLTT